MIDTFNLWYVKVRSVLESEEGQGMVEYGLILALVAVVVIGALSTIGGDVQTKFKTVANCLSSGGSC